MMNSIANGCGSFLLILLLLTAGCGQDSLVLARRAVLIPADGRVHQIANVSRRSGGAIQIDSLQSVPAILQFQANGPDRVEVLVRAPVLEGDVNPILIWKGQRYPIAVRFVQAPTNSFGDGFPDAMHLHSEQDRQDFRSWFVAIAEQAVALPPGKVPAEIDDCAALLRYAYREAMVQHDVRWFAAQPEPKRYVSLVSVAQYHYPATPLGVELFRVKPGSFKAGDVANGSFAQFADAHTLMELNTYWVSRDIHAALPGDLLFFRQLEQNSAYHSMIVTGPNSDWVIYHTGPIGRQKGEIRRVSMQDLLHHPDIRWRPLPENTNFLGVYRWNVLREGG